MSRQNNARENARANLAALKNAQQAQAPTPEVAAPAPDIRTKPIRVSVDWLPQDFRRVRAVCVDLAEELGIANVPASILHRAAVLQVLNDPAALEQLKAGVASGSGKI